MIVKTCSRCEQDLPIECFTINKSVKSGYGNICKSCHNSNNRQRHFDKKNDAAYRASSLIRAAKERCDIVTINNNWLIEKLEAGLCEVTSIPFDMECEKPARPFTPSLDRIDPTKGYTPENTQVVCWIYNRAKGVHSHEAVVTLAKALCTQKIN